EPRWGSALWVRAPLHAWAPVLVDMQRGGEYRVLLQGSAELEVVVNDPENLLRRHASDEGTSGLWTEPRLRLRPLDVEELVSRVTDRLARPGSAELPAEDEIRRRLHESWRSYEDLGVLPDDYIEVAPRIDEPTVLTDLNPGRHVLTLESPHGNAIVAETLVELVQGQRVRVVLDARRPPETKGVPLAGTLFVHPGWQIREVNLTFMRSQTVTKVVPFARMQPT